MAKGTQTLLIADDEVAVVEHMSRILQRAGYETVSTHCGKEVPGLAKRHKPDLIILDIVMPDMDGGEVVTRLSQDPETAKIPILYLTGIITKDESSLLKQSGDHAIIAKPTSSEELLKAVGTILPQ